MSPNLESGFLSDHLLDYCCQGEWREEWTSVEEKLQRTPDRPSSTFQRSSRPRSWRENSNPLSQRKLSRKHGIAMSIFSAILKKDLRLNFKRKMRTHLPLSHQATKRLERSPRFLRRISSCRLPSVLTFDETYLSMNDMEDQRKGYCQSKENPAPESWKKKPLSRWPTKILVGMGIFMRGKTRLYSVPSKVKMNHRLFIDLVLENLVKYDIPRLYPGEEKNVILHFDSATAHVYPAVVAWLQERKI